MKLTAITDLANSSYELSLQSMYEIKPFMFDQEQKFDWFW